jgi:hypothetical protein
MTKDHIPEISPLARPEVIVEFVFDNGLLFISVRNIGSRPAVNTRISFDSKFTGPGNEREISSLPLFQGLPFLGPQREINCFLDHSSSYFSRRQPTKISANLEYSDPEGHKFHAQIHHDLEIYRQLPYVQTFKATEEE